MKHRRAASLHHALFLGGMAAACAVGESDLQPRVFDETLLAQSANSFRSLDAGLGVCTRARSRARSSSTAHSTRRPPPRSPAHARTHLHMRGRRRRMRMRRMIGGGWCLVVAAAEGCGCSCGGAHAGGMGERASERACPNARVHTGMAATDASKLLNAADSVEPKIKKFISQSSPIIISQPSPAAPNAPVVQDLPMSMHMPMPMRNAHTLGYTRVCMR